MKTLIESISLGDISAVVIFIGALIGGVKYLKNQIEDFLKKLLAEQFKEVNTRLDAMNDTISKVDVQACKNFLVRYLADIERGAFLYDSEKQRFWEEYEHYQNQGGNSYIKEWVERLKKEGKL